MVRKTVSKHLPGSILGFTLLEVLAALAILGIAVVIILQLFSADLRSITQAGDMVEAGLRTEAKMRDVLDDETLAEKSWTETTEDDKKFDITVVQVQKQRTDNLQVILLEVTVKMSWQRGLKNRSFTLQTQKTVGKKV